MDQKEFEDLVYDMWYPERDRSRRARAQFSALDPEVRRTGLLRILISDQDGMIWRAIHLLLTEDNERFVPFVLPLFASDNPSIRHATAAAFATWGFSGAIAPLKKLARDDQYPKARAAAIRALGKCGAAEELALLRELFDCTDDDGNGWPLSKTAVEAARSIQERLEIATVESHER
jgi:HEAT repeat protein